MKKRGYLRFAALLCAACLLFVPLVSCSQPGASQETTPQSTDEEIPAGPALKNKRIAFTFDDGPTPVVTEKILDKLEELDGRATFFQVANRHNYIDNATYARIASLGCEVGSHTWSHPNGFASMDEAAALEQLTKSKEAIEAELGKKITLFRPVGGAVTDEKLALISSFGFHTVNWNIDTEDWKKQTSDVESVEAFIEEKVQLILEKAEDGDIILMHELYLSSYEIFARAADKLTEMGFELCTVSEILGLGPDSVPQAKVHTHGRPLFDPDAVG